MAYSVQADVQSAIGGSQKLLRASDQDKANEINTVVVAAAIQRADNLINAYCKKLYKTPFSPVPSLVVDLSAKLAAFDLLERARMIGDRDMELQQMRMKMLEDISRGRITVGEENEPTESELVTDAQHARPEDKAVSRDKLKWYA